MEAGSLLGDRLPALPCRGCDLADRFFQEASDTMSYSAGLSGRLGQSMFLRGAGTGILDTQFSIMQDRLAERRMRPLLPWLP